MGKDTSSALMKVAGGASIVFIGATIGRMFAYFYMLVVARWLGPDVYGLISIGMAIFGIAATMAWIGLPAGIVRYVSFFKGRNEPGKIKGVIVFSLKAVLLTSVISTAVLFTLSNWLALNVFHNLSVAPIIRIFSLAIPFFALTQIVSSVFQGFQNMKYRSYAKDIMPKIISLGSVLLLLYLGYGLLGAAVSYVIGFPLVFIFSIYLLGRKVFPELITKLKAVSVRDDLLTYAWPLIVVSAAWAVLGGIDTLMLGYFRTATEVGIYNAALPTARMMTALFASFTAIALPIVTELYAKKKNAAVEQTLKTTTKWLFSILLPLALLMILFSRQILSILFGVEYVSGAPALSILVVGFLISSVFALSSILLHTLKKTKLLLVNYVSVLGVCILLNYQLIPIYGLTGAAIATAVSLILLHALGFFEVYFFTKIQPFTLAFIKPAISAVLSLAIIYLLANFLFEEFPLHSLVVLGLIYLIFYLFLLLFMKGFSNEDIRVLIALEKKFGLDFKRVKKLFKRFV